MAQTQYCKCGHPEDDHYPFCNVQFCFCKNFVSREEAKNEAK